MKKLINVCLIAPNITGQGGSERVLVNIANYFVQEGHQVTLIVRDAGSAYPLHSQVELCVLDINSPSLKKIKQYVTWKINRTLKTLEKQKSFDLILSNYQSRAPFKSIYGTKIYYFVHNDYGADYLRLAANSSAKAEKFKQRLQSFYQDRHIIAVSESVLKSLEETLCCRLASGTVIYNPFNFDEIREKSRETVSEIPDNYILHAAKYGETKRFDVLLEAFSKLNDKTVKLVLLTESHPELVHLISKLALQDRVLIAGFQSNPHAWMRNARVVVLSSDSEGLPSVLIESLICGTQIVSTDFGRSVDTIFPTNMKAFIVEKSNSSALSQATDIALQKRIETRSLSDLAQFLSIILDKIVNESKSANEKMDFQTH